MRVGDVLIEVAAVVVVTAVLLGGAAWLGRRFRLPIRLQDRTRRRLARKQQVRRFSFLVAVGLFYLTLQAEWMPWHDQQREVLLATFALLVAFEMLLGSTRNPYRMRRPIAKAGERPGRVARALADQDLAGAVVAAMALPARSFRRSGSRRQVCGARTTTGGTCSRPVRAPGMRCHLHRGG
jgi:hypothetical protein